MGQKNRIDKAFAQRILKEWLFHDHNIEVTDANLFDVLNAGANWEKWALKYLETASEVLQLLEALKWVNDTYTVENLDAIWAYLKNNPEYNETFYIAFNDFYVETFSEMINYLINRLFDLQSIDEILHFMKLISKRKSELKKIEFPDGHNELTFVIKTTFDPEDGAFVHQVFMWKTQGIDEKDVEEGVYDEDGDDGDEESDNYDESDFDPKQEPFSIDQFICIRAKREYNKNMALIILKNLSYGDDLFSMFELDEEQVLHQKNID